MSHKNQAARAGRRASGIVGCCLLLTGATAASAQTTQSDAEMDLTPEVRPMNSVRASAFVVLDINGDGYLTRDEAQDLITRSQFSALDRNRDGRLDKAEYSGIPQ